MSESQSAHDSRALVRAYHEQSKHRFDVYAPGPASLDWDAQPNPFRRFAGCKRIELPLSADRIKLPFSALTATPHESVRPLTAHSIGNLLELSLAISAWKSMGPARWAVRCNPSSGNLHPVEAYLALPATELGPAGIYHYESLEHVVELRCALNADLSARLAALLPAGCLLVGLSLIPWREAWKYGVRAWRYCRLDLGHAIGALGYAAACNGWKMRELPGWSSAQIAQLLGLNRGDDFQSEEPEYPAALLMLGSRPSAPAPGDDLLRDLSRQDWRGKANRLDPRHLYRWDAVDDMARRGDPAVRSALRAEKLPRLPSAPTDPPAVDVIRQRRSARDFNPARSIDKGMFYRLLDGCRPRPGTPPWDLNQGRSRLHLLLFVHRVDGLTPGLYLLGAHRDVAEDLRGQMRPEFTWDHPDDCPEHLPCHRLISADARKAAMHLGCHQQICGDSAFALAMLGELATAVEADPGGYDMLLCEAGRLGQALYLNAQAEGIGSSGIGCFFDDPIHEMLGLKDQSLQALYMFTVGPAFGERGIIDEPAYQRHDPPPS